MPEPDRGQAERPVGAFVDPSGMGGPGIPAPMRTPGDEYHDEPEPDDSDRVPDPAPPSRVDRLRGWLRPRG